MRRRLVLLVVAVMAVLSVAGGVALAANLTGTGGDDELRGTNVSDRITGRGGDDDLYGRRGADSLTGGRGHDLIDTGPRDEVAQDFVAAGRGNDRIHAYNRPAARDVIDCGRGFDRVTVDAKDVFDGCNRVFRP